jgi:hypothetical protein
MLLIQKSARLHQNMEVPGTFPWFSYVDQENRPHGPKNHMDDD